jgi:hypothetical protein
VRFLICLLTRLKCEVVMSTCHAGGKCTRSFDAPKTELFSFYSKYINGTYKRALIRDIKLYHCTDDQHRYFSNNLEEKRKYHVTRFRPVNGVVSRHLINAVLKMPSLSSIEKEV